MVMAVPLAVPKTSPVPEAPVASPGSGRPWAPGELDRRIEELVELTTQVKPRRPLTWFPRWSPQGVPLRSESHLTVLMSALDRHGEFGGVTAEDTERWAQTMRLPRGWIVEVRDPDTEEWPSIVVPAEGVDGLLANLSPEGGALWTYQQAAEIIWAWMDGGLPDGCALVAAPE